MTGRIFLANVGANASHRFSSPLFPDGTFEFIPIPEDRDLRGSHVVRYRNLRSYYDPERDLLPYVPERLWDWPAHSDPEFGTFTYGDNCETSPRAASLKRLAAGDILLFLARLTLRADGSSTGRHGFYLVGYLDIDSVLSDVQSEPGRDEMARFQANAHVRRGLTDPELWDRFWVFSGSTRSRRFRKAVPVTRELADRVFTSADGSPWRWGGGRSDLQVIGSYTRSCRCVIDPATSEGERRARLLWEWVGEYGGQDGPATGLTRA